MFFQRSSAALQDSLDGILHGQFRIDMRLRGKAQLGQSCTGFIHVHEHFVGQLFQPSAGLQQPGQQAEEAHAFGKGHRIIHDVFFQPFFITHAGRYQTVFTAVSDKQPVREGTVQMAVQFYFWIFHDSLLLYTPLL